MNTTFFITGTGTGVGKTVVAAIITEALRADYWKPVQAGDLDAGDSQTVQRLVSNKKTIFHPNAYALRTPMSPHAAAALDGVAIDASSIRRPKTKNALVIEGAGGVLVPLNDSETIMDLMLPTDQVIVVSKHELGSINHTLLTIEALKQRNLSIFGIIFNGPETPTTETVISKMTGVRILGRIDTEPYMDARVVLDYAEIFNDEFTTTR
ncbi:dethiobiotin synthase [Altibacter sp.]|uniref:dethiobiotin synthase n=1 Tax=Altibacter sp. TaxID=2024823 RepID=UPI000C8EC87E|nr:dethiobiotin synthase [Altibacter sp.]MAP53619.1 dethiobiotin synthase [Altibacter sp.]|tara:strand:- start:23 stop:649 length:627 start_codon:yes stop_codon:yes gene_type:complete